MPGTHPVLLDLPQLPSTPRFPQAQPREESVFSVGSGRVGLGAQDSLSARLGQLHNPQHHASTAVPFDPASESLIMRHSPCFHKGENNCFQPRQRTLCTALGPEREPREPLGERKDSPAPRWQCWGGGGEGWVRLPLSLPLMGKGH